MSEIIRRFDAIKDHKPKATKKLNELGDILSSAFKHDPDTADEMWRYIVDLNFADDASNSKFYVAQVYKKIAERLSPEDAAIFLAMDSDRIRLLVEHWPASYNVLDCLCRLVRGYVGAQMPENALLCIELFYGKFGGASAGRKEVFRIARGVSALCAELIRNGLNADDAELVLASLERTENPDLNAMVQIAKDPCASEDVEARLFVAEKCKEPVEFFDLLWEARGQCPPEELRERWIEYVDGCAEGEPGPYNYIREDEECPYERSKTSFYCHLAKGEDSLLNHYFNKPRLYDLESALFTEWVFDEDWERICRFLPQVLIASDEPELEPTLKRLLKRFMDACFFESGRDSFDGFDRSYKQLMESRADAFARALVQSSAAAAGCTCHESYHAVVKQFVQKLHGNLEMLSIYGFAEAEDSRTAEERLRDFAHSFIDNGVVFRDARSTEYSLIENAYSDEGFSLSSLLCANDDIAMRWHRLAVDEIAEFYFKFFPAAYGERAEMISACIRGNNLDRAIELVDMMEHAKTADDYEELNGWGRQNMLTVKRIIDWYDYSEKDGFWSHELTDEMREAAAILVDRALPLLPPRSQAELKNELHKLHPEGSAFDSYIDGLLRDVDEYIGIYANRTPRRSKTADVNRLSWDIGRSFKSLSEKGRLDVIALIMEKFASAKDCLTTIPYVGWIRSLVREASAETVFRMYKDYPDIFEVWIEEPGLRDFEIIELAQSIGKCCARADFKRFRNMVISHKGYVEGLDDCFEATPENTESQLLFDGDSARILLECTNLTHGYRNVVGNVVLSLSIERRSKTLRAVNVETCRINGIEVDSAGFQLDGDSLEVWSDSTEDEYVIYPDFFEKHGIRSVDTVEISMSLVDDADKVEELIPLIVIKHDMHSGEYKAVEGV